MNRLKQNKPLLIAVGVVLIAALVGGLLFFTQRNNSTTSPMGGGLEEEIKTLSAEDIGLEVTVRNDGRAMMFEITKPEGIEHVEYQITYIKELEGEEVPEGIFGEMNIAEDGITKTDMREFGTCSSGRCRYDEGVKDVKIIMRITKDNEIYSLEHPVEL